MASKQWVLTLIKLLKLIERLNECKKLTIILIIPIYQILNAAVSCLRIQRSNLAYINASMPP